MIKTLDIYFDHDIPETELLCRLELLLDMVGKPNILTIMKLDQQYRKDNTRSGSGLLTGKRRYTTRGAYMVTEERSRVYEFNCQSGVMTYFSMCEGDFTGRGFSWSEGLLDRQTDPNINATIAKRGYCLAERLKEEIERIHRTERETREKDKLATFLKALKPITGYELIKT